MRRMSSGWVEGSTGLGSCRGLGSRHLKAAGVTPEGLFV